MKTHLAWIRVTAAATVAASAAVSGEVAPGQYTPYDGAPQYSNVAPYGVAQTQPPVYSSTTYPSAIRGASTPAMQQAYTPVSQDRYAPTAQAPYGVRSQYQPPQYQQPASRPTYPSLARQSTGTVLPGSQAATTQGESLPMPGATMNGQAVQQSYEQSLGGNNGSSNYPSTDGYYVSDPGCTSGACGYQDYGVGGYFNQSSGGGTQWFGGIFGLLMTRDNPDFRRFTVQAAPASYPYYPTADVTVLSTPNADHDYRGGFEVRFGSTIGGGYDASCDPNGYGCSNDVGGYGSGYGSCGCNSCAAPEYAWEVGYWFLDDDINTALVVDAVPTDANRMYGMKNFAGMEYNDLFGGLRPVNEYFDYEVPVTDPIDPAATDVRILAQRVRSNFRAQNLELNFLRLPVCGLGGYECGGSPLTVTTLWGVRYLRIDDDFEYATMWGYDEDGPGGGTGPLDPTSEVFYTPFDGSGNELYYDVNVDNHLTGFQLGGNMNYCVTCRCNVFWNTNFGLYNNHIKSRQRVYGEQGPATWVQSGEDATVRSNKDDVAFAGEMVIGSSYDFSCHWRGILAYRAVAVSGLALSVDQMPEDFANEAQVALIDSDGSIIIHGALAGVECRY